LGATKSISRTFLPAYLHAGSSWGATQNTCENFHLVVSSEIKFGAPTKRPRREMFYIFFCRSVAYPFSLSGNVTPPPHQTACIYLPPSSQKKAGSNEISSCARKFEFIFLQALRFFLLLVPSAGRLLAPKNKHNANTLFSLSVLLHDYEELALSRAIHFMSESVSALN
jgi:hypothetical protein